METALTITRPHDAADDIIIRECAMMGEIKRTREENARLKAEIEAEKQQDLRWMAAARMGVMFAAGAGVAALMVALAIMFVGG